MPLLLQPLDPDVMEDVDGELFGSLPVRRDSHDQSEDEAMSHLVERMQRELVARGNCFDECRPILLQHRTLGLGIQTSPSVAGG